MKYPYDLAHVRVVCKSNRRQAKILDDLYAQILSKDQIWHYFWDEDGITLRVHRNNLRAITKALDSVGVEYCDVQPYTDRMEYRGTRELIKDLIRVFHLISDLQCRHGDMGQFLERIVHQVAVNARKAHFEEAKMLADLALRRAKVAGWAEEQE